MRKFVYHYTDTARLPWILRTGELQPGRNSLGGFPDPDFLWATTLPIPDATASSLGAAALAALRRGDTRTVRLTLSAADFEPWPAIVANFPAWTPHEIRRLEKAARGNSRPANWRCRAMALPRASWLSVETRGYADRDWSPFDSESEVFDLDRAGRECLGVWIGEIAYFSVVLPQDNGNVGYSVFTGRREAA